MFILLASCAPLSASAISDPTITPLNPTDYVATLISRALNATAEARQGTPLVTLDSSPVPAGTATLPPPAIYTTLPTVIPTATLFPTPTPFPTFTPCPPLDPCPEGDHMWLARPVGADKVTYVDQTYRYGDTQNGAREPHHGVEFQNPPGTPLLAVAPATVIVAGNDWKDVYGPALYFYGTLVVLELDQQLHGQPVYALYGHLSEIDVQVGQRVTTGEMLGRVGASGVALGPHLHFEVRVGQDDYYSTRNPELWLLPLPYNGKPWGVLAGRVIDKAGNPLPGISVAIRSVSIRYPDPISKYAVTYAQESLNGDDLLMENFAMGDLPPGTYEISVNTTTLYRQTITIKPGEVTLLEFIVNRPAATPTATATP